MGVSAFAAVTLAIQALSPQFDLACTNTATGEAYRIRIDLENNRWCEGDCPQGRPLAAVDADRYTLFDYDNRGARLRTTGLSFVNRQTGEHYESMISIGVLSQTQRRNGQCAREPYSGMPEPRL